MLLLHRPALRGKAVVVSGSEESRHGIVLAKSELAKRCGIQTGESMIEARAKCPDLICIPPNYRLYLRISEMVRGIYSDYSDQCEPFGLDESWIDVTASAGLFGSGETIANEIRDRIKREIGITASIGVSYNKIFAKLGSDMRKPDATTLICCYVNAFRYMGGYPEEIL